MEARGFSRVRLHNTQNKVLFPVVSYAKESSNDRGYLGCLCFKNDDRIAVTFAAFDKDKNYKELTLQEARKIDRDTFGYLVYIAENSAKLLNKYKDRESTHFNHDYNIRWKDILNREPLKDYQTVRGLKLIEQENGKVIEIKTPQDLAEWAEKRSRPQKRRQEKERDNEER